MARTTSWDVIVTSSYGGAYRSPGLSRKVYVSPSSEAVGRAVARSGRRMLPPSSVVPPR